MGQAKSTIDFACIDTQITQKSYHFRIGALERWRLNNWELIDFLQKYLGTSILPVPQK